MASLNGKVLARQQAGDLCFLVIGQVTCHHTPALRQYAEEGLSRGATSIQVDLRDCQYCDSTFLGTLLQLQQHCQREHQNAFRLVSPSAQFRQMLAQIGAERLFQIVDEATGSDMEMTWQQLADSVDRAGLRCFKQNVVDAHRALASVGGALGQRFGPLAEALNGELEQEHGPSAERKP